ncbi:transcriptional regulator [Carboxydothermus islandicus]|uniref:Transcriptional regulator n=1 Tax=Carboxydothermus islandicus TaxID=661089 RepID=A0A1L8D0Z4_9THEO|nr:helix-turn-helix transcriptional regulator [Carboxydothermus islandicus]GAV24771.1 transcriptional regulator [Carboxydothermus islandicus]
MLKEARKKAGLSIQEAAFRLHIGARTLVSYENGHTMVPPDVILKAAEVYNEPMLCARYCAKSCPIGQVYANPVEIKDLAIAVLGLLKEEADVHRTVNRLIDITHDGIITEDEMEEFKKILQELIELEQRIQALKLWAVKTLSLQIKPKEKAALKAAY